jgi:hypothetical protein
MLSNVSIALESQIYLRIHPRYIQDIFWNILGIYPRFIWDIDVSRIQPICIPNISQIYPTSRIYLEYIPDLSRMTDESGIDVFIPHIRDSKAGG